MERSSPATFSMEKLLRINSLCLRLKESEGSVTIHKLRSVRGESSMLSAKRDDCE
jgi:hypothetical protein